MDPDHARLYPVHLSSIRRPADTIVVADALGEFDAVSGANGPHAYTLDPPKLIQWRWGTGSGRNPDGTIATRGRQTPADPRHKGDTANFLYMDGRAGSLTMEAAGYAHEDPRQLPNANNDVGEGNNSLWNGTGTP